MRKTKTKKKKGLEQPDLDERIRRFFGYWGFCQGYLVPRWIEKMAGYEAVEIYYERYIGQSEHLDHFGCAIELERRAEPISTLKELRRIAVKITRMGYDFTAAAALAIEVAQERAGLQAEMETRRAKENASLPRQQADAHPDAKQMLRELRAKQLPQGKAANLEVIRTVVGLPKKGASEK